MASKAKVIICVPVSDTDAMRALTAQAIGGAIIGAKEYVVDMVLRRSCDIVSNRTWLVQNAIKAGATHILFVDSDMLFPYDIIPKLLAHKKEIIGVEYNKREFPLKKLCEPLEGEDTDKLYKARYTGTGLLLIDLSIFEKMGAPSEMHPKGNPWFSFGRDSKGALIMGEDVWFCNVARDAGYDIWVDPTLTVKHIGEHIY